MDSNHLADVDTNLGVPTNVQIYGTSEQSSTPSSLYSVLHANEADNVIEVAYPSNSINNPTNSRSSRHVISLVIGTEMTSWTKTTYYL